MRKTFLLIVLLLNSLRLFAGNIAVVSIAAGDKYQKAVENSIKNKQQYCELHGYDFILRTKSLDPSRHIYWSKILLLQEVLENHDYDWVVWIDADAMIMNFGVKLEDFVDERILKTELLVSDDPHPGIINNGVFFIKNTEKSRCYLKDVYACTDWLGHKWPETMAMISELKKPKYKSFATIAPQRLFNSFANEVGSYGPKRNYKRGDFLVHFPSSNLSNLGCRLAKYAPLVHNNPELFNLDHYLGIYGFNLSPRHSTVNQGYMSFEQKQQFRQRLEELPNIESILEIGFNAGHSSESFFLYCNNLKKLTSFDINVHRYTPVGVEYMRRSYKDRFEFIEGDSRKTIPAHARESEKKYDLIYVDGDHSFEGCYYDVLNCKACAHPQTILWVDDFNGHTIKNALYKLENEGVIKLSKSHVSRGEHGIRQWVEARYLFKN